jgi:DNA-binding Xre family transcriptional regulator
MKNTERHKLAGPVWTCDWLLDLMMHQRNISSSQLQQRLRDVGISITIQHINRLRARRPRRFSVLVVAAISAVFNCDTGDLLPRKRLEHIVWTRPSADSEPPVQRF